MALALERKHSPKQKRDATCLAQADGHNGYQQAPAAGLVVRFAGTPGGAPPRGRWEARTYRWAVGGHGVGVGVGGGGSGTAAGGSGRYGQGRVGSQHPSN